MTRAAAALLAALLGVCVSGCGGSDTDPSPAGSSGGDPGADTDADWLTDGEEASLGTDPSAPDTDGDSYLDGDEVLEETDPLDPESRIYQGGWPYQRSKDELVDPGFEGTAEVGAPIPRLVAYDQFGELVDLYDFARHGHRVVVDLSALWCGPCKDLAAWLEGAPSSLDDKPQFAPVRDLVDSGEIYWVTVVFEDGIGNAAGPAQAEAWAEEFPNPKIAVLADNDRAMYGFLFPGSMPSIQVIDEDMTLRVYDRFDYEPALQALLE